MAQRSPLRAIENSPSKLLKHVRKPGLSPSKYDAIRCLDDEENWKERTEVVTKTQHNMYVNFAKELVSNLVNQLPEVPNRKKEESTHPPTYRVTPEVLADSDSEYESATEYEEARPDFEITSPSSLVTGDTNAVSPAAHSTLLNTTPSTPNTPERSDMFGNSLLSSFEKMKLEDTMTESKMDVDSSFADTSRSKIKVSRESLSPARCMTSSTLDENVIQSVEQVEDHMSDDAPIEEKSVEKHEPTATAHEVRTTKISDEDQDFKNSAKIHELDVLNCLNVANYSPFQTKSAVSNSPSDKHMYRKKGELSDVETENVDIETPSNKIKSEHENNSVKAPTGNEVCTEEQEEIIVPTKGYNLDFLSAIDDTNINPFQTKSTVLNSPSSDKHMSKKTEVSICKEENSVKMKNIEAFSEMTATPLNKSSKISEVMGIADEAEVTESSNPVNGYSPLQTKPTVTNSPIKDDCSLSLAGELSEINVKTENVDIEAPSNKIIFEHEESNSVMAPTGNEVCTEEQEEIIVPTKGYNLDFLSAIDDTNINPFQTKSTVLNSPLKQEPELHTIRDLKVEDPCTKPYYSNIIENVTKTNKVSNTGDETILHKSKVDQKENIEVLKITLDLDILNEVDSNINPFQTKSLITNSPVKDDETILSSDKLEKTDSAAADVLKKSYDETSKTGVEDSHAENALVSPGEDVTSEDQEFIVSTKSYDLDALNCLDDENFNPFQTKSTVVNSPVKENTVQAALVNSEEETVIAKSTQNCMKKEFDGHINDKEANDTENTFPKKDLGHCKSKTSQESVNITDKIVIANERVSGSDSEYFVEGSTVADKMEEDITVPGCSYDLNSLDKTDTDFDPFKTRAAFVNSPCRNFQVNKNDTTAIALQDTAKSNNVTEDSAMRGHVSESLNELDDPNIDHFVTKSSVINSPVKEKNVSHSNDNHVTTNKLEEMEQSSKKDMPSSSQEMNDENVHKSEEKQNTQSVMEERDQELESKQDINTKGNTKICLKMGVSITGEDVQMCVNAEDTEQRNTETISTSFDILDYNPFETKSNDFDSPKREEFLLSSETSTIKESEVSSKDCGVFTVPNKPKSRDCILKDKDKEVHNNLDVYVSSNLESERTGDEDLVKEGRDSLRTEKADETEFKNCADFFSNEEELEMLGKAGGHYKVNSIRDSLFIKFDPLAAKRQSLDVRGSCLMSFSPTLSKSFDKEEELMPVKALVSSVANETQVDTSVMEATVVEDEGNQTVLSTGKAINLLELSICNQTVNNARPVYTEQEMNEALKKQELFLQGVSLRRYQEFQQQMKMEKEEFERKLKAVEKQEEQKTIIITGLEEEVKELQSDLEKMKKLVMESLRSQKIREIQHTKVVEDLKKRLQEEIGMNQETKAQQDSKLKQVQAECDKTESAFFDLVKKYERTQAIVKEQKKNEESMKICIKELELKITQKKEAFSEMLNVHEEKLKQAADHMEEMKKAHANEMGRAEVMLKRAEIKIINQKELLERCEKENQRLSAFVDDFTNKFN